MAVSPLPSSKRDRVATVTLEKLKQSKKRRLVESVNSASSQDSTRSPRPASPKKRNKAPGVRVRGSRIYDDKNGKTCHQCRQKTMDFFASCKGTRDGKPCSICFCYKCLLNRYGEKAEEVVVLDYWACPKCRGICNCSCCMKKRGEKPTGVLVRTAKAVGFSSVLELLHHKDPVGDLEDSAGKGVEAGEDYAGKGAEVGAGNSDIPKLGALTSDLVGDASKRKSLEFNKKPFRSQKKDDDTRKMKDSTPSMPWINKKGNIRFVVRIYDC